MQCTLFRPAYGTSDGRSKTGTTSPARRESTKLRAEGWTKRGGRLKRGMSLEMQPHATICSCYRMGGPLRFPLIDASVLQIPFLS